MASAHSFDLVDLDDEDYGTILAEDVEFSGTVRFEEPFMVRGVFEGSIESSGDLMVEEQARVRAEIVEDRVVIKGEVIGNVTAMSVVRVFPCGRLIGDVTAPEVVLESGCFFSGVCSMPESG